MIRRRCFDRESSPNPAIVDARCDVICRIGSGPCAISSLRILSAVTAAAAATAMGECVFNGLRPSLLKLVWCSFDRETTDDRDRGFGTGFGGRALARILCTGSCGDEEYALGLWLGRGLL